MENKPRLTSQFTTHKMSWYNSLIFVVQSYDSHCEIIHPMKPHSQSFFILFILWALASPYVRTKWYWNSCENHNCFRMRMLSHFIKSLLIWLMWVEENKTKLYIIPFALCAIALFFNEFNFFFCSFFCFFLYLHSTHDIFFQTNFFLFFCYGFGSIIIDNTCLLACTRVEVISQLTLL